MLLDHLTSNWVIEWKGRHQQGLAGAQTADVVQAVLFRDWPPERRVRVILESDVLYRLALQHNVLLGEVRGFAFDLEGFVLGVNELGETGCNARSHRPPIIQKQQKFLISARKDTAKLQRGPRHDEDRRCMQSRIDLHQMNKPLGLLTDIREPSVGVEQQLHLQRAQIAMSELNQWGTETRDRLRSE